MAKGKANKKAETISAETNTWEIGKNLVVIPFSLKEMAEMAIKGWRKYFAEEMYIVTVGEVEIKSADHSIITDDTSLRNISRLVSEKFPKAEDFILSSDKIFCVNEFDSREVNALKVESDALDVLTRSVLEKENLPIHNYSECVPQRIDVKILDEVLGKYKEGSIVPLYFNTAYAKRIPCVMNVEHNAFKCNITRSNANWSRLDDMFRARIWFYVSAEGYQPQLTERLFKRYSK